MVVFDILIIIKIFATALLLYIAHYIAAMFIYMYIVSALNIDRTSEAVIILCC